MKNLTAQTYETGPTGDPATRWTTVISEATTGVVHGLKYSATEVEGRSWGDAQLNGKPSPYGQGWQLRNLDESPLPASGVAYGDFSDGSAAAPPPAKPTIPITCWTCGEKLEVKHQYSWYGDELTLEMAHCGKKETKTFTLAQATELAKIGYMAFLS